MIDAKRGGRQFLLALVAAIAVLAALWLLVAAAFPYFYGESGSGGYAREHRLEAIGQVLLAAGLLWVAWQCIRRSFSTAIWAAIGVTALALLVASFLSSYWAVPEHARPIGDRWYVTKTSQPGEIDTVYYGVYYKKGLHYRHVEDLASEYRFVPPDCVIYRGLRVSSRPLRAACGHRAPFESPDTLTGDAALLARARTQPSY